MGLFSVSFFTVIVLPKLQINLIYVFVEKCDKKMKLDFQM